MKTVAAFSVDTDRLIEIKRGCKLHRISLSSYIDYVLEKAPAIDDELAQTISAHRQGKTPEEIKDLLLRKPVYDIVAKGWHFHKDDKSNIITCMRKNCDLERVPCPDYYEDAAGNIYSSRSDKLLWSAV